MARGKKPHIGSLFQDWLREQGIQEEVNAAAIKAARRAARVRLPAVHPGAFLREEVLKGYGLSVTAGAAALGVTRQALSELVNERTRLSADMAIRIGKAFGLSMETLLGLQHAFDIEEARKRTPSIKVARFKGKPAEAQPRLF
jgi:addiction module HigA family antidote